jgi:hypothetical protein
MYMPMPRVEQIPASKILAIHRLQCAVTTHTIEINLPDLWPAIPQAAAGGRTAPREIAYRPRGAQPPPSRPHAKGVTNKVVTAKYNVATFLPIFLLEMFSRVAYLYFLLQARCGAAQRPGEPPPHCAGGRNVCKLPRAPRRRRPVLSTHIVQTAGCLSHPPPHLPCG